MMLVISRPNGQDKEDCKLKKDYLSPEFDFYNLSFQSVLSSIVDVSKNEHGSEDYNDDDTGDF